MSKLKNSRILLLVLSFFFVTSGYAQDLSETDYYEDEAHFGVRAQLDFNRSISESDLIQWGPGVSVGIAYYAPFGRMTYFNTGLLFSYNTFKLKGTGGTKYSPYHLNGHLSMPTLRLPMDLGVKFIDRKNLIVSVYTGPHLYFNFKLNADYERKRSQSVEQIKEEMSSSGMEIGWGLGAAVDFKRRWHLQFEGTVGLSHFGATHDLKIGHECDFRRAELSLGLGYNF